MTWTCPRGAREAREGGGGPIRPRGAGRPGCPGGGQETALLVRTPSLPAKIVPTAIRRLKLSGRLHFGLGTPSLEVKILPESSPPKSGILVRRSAVGRGAALAAARGFGGAEVATLRCHFLVMYKFVRCPSIYISLSLHIDIYTHHVYIHTSYTHLVHYMCQ